MPRSFSYPPRPSASSPAGQWTDCRHRWPASVPREGGFPVRPGRETPRGGMNASGYPDTPCELMSRPASSSSGGDPQTDRLLDPPEEGDQERSSSTTTKVNTYRQRLHAELAKGRAQRPWSPEDAVPDARNRRLRRSTAARRRCRPRGSPRCRPGHGPRGPRPGRRRTCRSPGFGADHRHTGDQADHRCRPALDEARTGR